MTITRPEPYAFVTKVIDLFRDWLTQRRELNGSMEYAADPGELERVARGLDVAPAELEMLVRRGSQGTNALPEMLTALGIYETARMACGAGLIARHGARLFGLHAKASVPSGARGRDSCDELCGILRERGHHRHVEVQKLKIGTESGWHNGLPDKAQVGSQGLNFTRAQLARNERHRRVHARMVSLAHCLSLAFR